MPQKASNKLIAEMHKLTETAEGRRKLANLIVQIEAILASQTNGYVLMAILRIMQTLADDLDELLPSNTSGKETIIDIFRKL